MAGDSRFTANLLCHIFHPDSLAAEGAYKRAINTTNPLGTKGALADAVAQLVQTLWSQQYSFLAPVTFRVCS